MRNPLLRAAWLACFYLPVAIKWATRLMLCVHVVFAQAVADVIRTTLGPRSMLKMILDPMGGIVMTNDGNAILREIDVSHPAAKSMIELSRTQDEEVGDGTASVIILGMCPTGVTLPLTYVSDVALLHSRTLACMSLMHAQCCCSWRASDSGTALPGAQHAPPQYRVRLYEGPGVLPRRAQQTGCQAGRQQPRRFVLSVVMLCID